MGRSSSSTQQESSIRRANETHPIWQGIGCVLMVVIPAISIFIGNVLVNYALADKAIKARIPYQLLGYPQLPDILNKSAGLKPYLYLLRVENLYAYIAASIICMLLISSVISMVYAVVYRMANPYRYGPLDEPPSRIKAKKHSR
jgi:hypothetical protein